MLVFPVVLTFNGRHSLASEDQSSIVHHVFVFRRLPVLSFGLMMPAIGVGGGGWGALGTYVAGAFDSLAWVRVRILPVTFARYRDRFRESWRGSSSHIASLRNPG